jgi:23S rRNA (adenine2503-C2)-methyltransferase
MSGSRAPVAGRPLPALLDLDAASLERLVVEAGGRPFHARSLRAWILRRGVLDFEAMTDLPRSLVENLRGKLVPLSTRILERIPGADGTVKLLLGLADGERIETVVIPGKSGATLCISTQVGCPVGCRFCASGIAGVVRNLTAGEIVEQFLHGRAEAQRGPTRRVARAVIMGIGEPLLNMDDLLEALACVTDRSGYGLGTRRVTVSTIGHPDRIRALAARGRPYPLAVSLHAPDDALRARLVPSMAKVRIDEIVAAAADYFEATGREVTFEYVLLGGVNDSPEHARALARLLRGTRSTVNLIPWNRVPELPFEPPAEGVPERFARILRAAKIPATIRWSRGADASAACGQLRIDRARS